MVPIDYSTLQSRTLARLNMGSSDPAADNVDEYVNEALHFLETASADGWPWMRRQTTLTTTAGTSTATFSALSTLAGYTVEKVLSAKILIGTIYQPLNMLSPAEAEQLYPSTDRGQPEAWFVEGQTLYLYPTPDAAYTIPLRVVITETDLGGSSSTPILPVVFHSAIVEASVLLYYQTLQESAKVDVQQKIVAGWINKMGRYGREYPSAPKIKVRDWL